MPRVTILPRASRTSAASATGMSGLDRADPTLCDRDVGDAIDAGRRVEHASAPDEEIVPGSAGERSAGERHRALFGFSTRAFSISFHLPEGRHEGT